MFCVCVFRSLDFSNQHKCHVPLINQCQVSVGSSGFFFHFAFCFILVCFSAGAALIHRRIVSVGMCYGTVR